MGLGEPDNITTTWIGLYLETGEIRMKSREGQMNKRVGYCYNAYVHLLLINPFLRTRRMVLQGLFLLYSLRGALTCCKRVAHCTTWCQLGWQHVELQQLR